MPTFGSFPWIVSTLCGKVFLHGNLVMPVPIAQCPVFLDAKLTVFEIVTPSISLSACSVPPTGKVNLGSAARSIFATTYLPLVAFSNDFASENARLKLITLCDSLFPGLPLWARISTIRLPVVVLLQG